MKAKKSNKANLEKKRGVLFQISLVIVLGVVLSAFEWTTADMKTVNLDYIIQGDEEPIDLPPVTFREKPKPPEPPKVKQIEIVPDDKEVDDLILIDDDTSPEDSVEIYAPVELPPEPEDNTIYDLGNIQIFPEFPGGEMEMNKFIVDNLKVPEIVKEAGGGKVFVSFVIDKDGSITMVEIIRGCDPFLDAEAIRVVKSMPKWSPGFRNGKYVKARFILPISVRIN